MYRKGGLPLSQPIEVTTIFTITTFHHQNMNIFILLDKSKSQCVMNAENKLIILYKTTNKNQTEDKLAVGCLVFSY